MLNTTSIWWSGAFRLANKRTSLNGLATMLSWIIPCAYQREHDFVVPKRAKAESRTESLVAQGRPRVGHHGERHVASWSIFDRLDAAYHFRCFSFVSQQLAKDDSIVAHDSDHPNREFCVRG